MTRFLSPIETGASRIRCRLPHGVNRAIRVLAWLSFITEVAIVGTGGAVRVTDSGLGCPTWPTCTPESLIPTGEMGIHGAIEFGNRMMTGVVGIIAVITLILVWRMRRQRRDLFALSLALVLGVLAQALVGGVTVLTGLNPVIVGFHFTASLIMVSLAAVLLHRVHTAPGERQLIVPKWFARITYTTSLVVAVTVAVGVLTTAVGPHSGDSDVVRSGVNAELLAHFHAWPGYATLLLTVVLLVAAAVRRLPVFGWIRVLLAIEIAQVLVGLVQANTGLPPLLVGTHMVLACLLAAAMTMVVLRCRGPRATGR